MLRLLGPAAVLAAAACSLACGEPAVPPKIGDERASLPVILRPPSGATLTPPLSTTLATDDDAPVFEHPERLQRFFEAVGRLRSKEAEDDVRVVHFGDSHVAADLQTGATRRALQAELGDGGRGFVALGAPYKGYIQEGVRAGTMHHFEPARGRWKKGHYDGDGLYGLGGVGIMASKRGATASSELKTPSASLELYYLETPKGGSFDLLVDGARVATVRSRRASTQSAFFRAAVPHGNHTVETRAHGDGEVRVFGVAADKPEVGLVYDALGINGARAHGMLEWGEDHFHEQLTHRAPKLVVLAFGTNEAGDDTTDALYTQRLLSVLGRVARAAPESSCLLVGPPDRAAQTPEGWQTMPRVLQLVQLQRQVAEAAGCAFYDQLRAMGGPGTVARWAEESPPRAGRDRVHYTRDSYVELGNRFAKDLLDALAAYAPEASGDAIATRR